MKTLKLDMNVTEPTVNDVIEQPVTLPPTNVVETTAISLSVISSLMKLRVDQSVWFIFNTKELS